MGRGDISKDMEIPVEVVGVGVDFDAGCHLMRIAMRVNNFDIKSRPLYDPIFLGIFVRA